MPSNRSYKELIAMLKNQFSPRGSVFRNEFYKLSQNCGETINEWYIKIKNIAISNKFVGMLDSIVRDKLISGMLNGLVLDRLCEEEHIKTSNEILDVAFKKEASIKQIAVMADVNKFKWTNGHPVHKK